jgi:hypothetical protein
MTSEKERRQEAEWQILQDRITATLDQFGKKDAFGKGDYWLVDENWGWRDQQLAVQNLDFLRPKVVKALQELLQNLPHWQITMGVDGRGEGRNWPNMGLIIYDDEIIDELQREYLPEPYRNLKYEGGG